MTRPRWTACLLLTLLAVGCGGPLTATQRLAGEWVGRPETAAQRVLREWPGRRGEDGKIDPENPEIVAAIRDAPPTDLEQAADIAVALRLAELGGATLSLPGEDSLEGDWSVSNVEGRRAQLEISIVGDTASGDAEPTRRRFDLEFLREGEGFVLKESGADPRFGQLLFTPKGAPGSAGESEVAPAAPRSAAVRVETQISPAE